MTAIAGLRFDRSGFFEWLTPQARRFELVKGEPRMLPWVTGYHARVASNWVIVLGSALDRNRYDISQGDFAVATGPDSLRFADVMVVPYIQDGNARETDDAILLVEVLSTSSHHVDFHEKLIEYSALPSVQTYVVCAQDAARAWIWTRVDGQWPGAPEIVEGHGATFAIPALGLVVDTSDIFRGIPA